MKNVIKKSILFILILVTLFSCVISAYADNSGSEYVTSETITIHGKSVSNNTTSLDLCSLSSAEVNEAAEQIAKLNSLREVELTQYDGTCLLPFSDYAKLKAAAPQAHFHYHFDLFGQDVSTDTEELRYVKTDIGNSGIEELYGILPYLDNLNYLSFDRCGTDDWCVAKLRKEFPDIKIAWRIFFTHFSCMTDTDYIWAMAGLYDDRDALPIRYCTDIKYLDLGHNGLTRCDFVQNMPNLEVGIFACGDMEKIDALASCTNLEYLEICEAKVRDLEPVSQLPNIKHLNFGDNPYLKDITVLTGLENVGVIRLYGDKLFMLPDRDAQIAVIEEHFPNTELSFIYETSDGSLNGGRWRYDEGHYQGEFVERYLLLREQMHYNDENGASILYD